MFPIEVFIAPDILLIANYFLNIFWIFSKMKTSRVYHDGWESKYPNAKNKEKEKS